MTGPVKVFRRVISKGWISRLLVTLHKIVQRLGEYRVPKEVGF